MSDPLAEQILIMIREAVADPTPEERLATVRRALALLDEFADDADR